MKLPSVNYLYSSARSGFQRFPLAILSATLAAITAIILIEEDSLRPDLHLYNLMLTGALGIPSFVFAGMLSQRRFSSHLRKWILYGIVTVLLLLIYFTLPTDAHNTFQPYIRYTIYNIICHLAVAFAPYLLTGELNGFWNYNKSLFLRFLTALLYSGVLYSGLALAILTVDILFDTNIDPKRYFELFVVVIWIFNTWFFVFGLPKDFQQLEAETNYPRGLKIFTQYILIPLLAVYIAILYAYGIKIIFTWDWPQGIVSYLIMIVAVAGILTMLLIHPYAKLADSGWINYTRKGYYLLLYPLVILLFIAIGIRISDYGITVNRYIIVVTGLWILIATTYSLFRPLQIKFIPISLAVILLLVSFGPWGMFAVSERDQVGRMEAILSSNDLLENGKFVGEVRWETDSLPDFYAADKLVNNNILSDSLHNEIYSIVMYLGKYHGFSRIRPWFEQDIDSLLATAEELTPDSIYYGRAYDSEETVYMESMGLQSVPKSTPNNQSAYHSFQRKESFFFDTKGYDHLMDLGTINLQQYSAKEVNQMYYNSINRRDQSYTVKLDSISMEFHISTDMAVFTFNLQPQITRLMEMDPADNGTVVPDAIMEIKNPDDQNLLIITNLELFKDPEQSTGKVIVTEIGGMVLFNDR